MTTNDNLPEKTTSRDVATTTEPTGGLVARGLAAIRSRKSPQAIAKTDPEEFLADARFFYNRGVVYAREHQDDANEDYHQAMRNQYDRAIEDYDQPIRLHPNYAEAFYDRG